MLNNLNEQSPVECMSLEEAQKLFEAACNAGALCEDLELSATMYFDRKDRNGQYMCCTTLAVFNIFCKGLDAGFEHNP